MKKLAAIFTFLLAFTISANAQESTLAPEDAAKKDVLELHEAVNLTDSQQMHLTSLFKMKHEIMQDPNIPETRKKDMSHSVALKLGSTIDEKQMGILNSNPELLERLTK